MAPSRQEPEIKTNFEREVLPRTFVSNADCLHFGEGAEALNSIKLGVYLSDSACSDHSICTLSGCMHAATDCNHLCANGKNGH